MSNENARPFDDMMAQIAKDVQNDIAGPAGGTTPPEAAPSAPAATPAAAAPAATPATTAEEKRFANKFKSVEELERAHHVLMHNFNALKGENDKLLARVASAPEPQPLSPGRADPSKPVERVDPDHQLWVEQYGINPADIDARIERKLAEQRAALEAPARAMQAADAYMMQSYPEFVTKVEEVKAFVLANPTLKNRVAALWGDGLFAEAMEIGWLAYDNALRATVLATSVNAATQAKVNVNRGDASMLSSQAAGSREVVPTTDGYPRTPEDWERLRTLRQQGRDQEANRILYGPLIAHIPELNPRV